MRKINGDDGVFSKLIKRKDEVVYNLFYLICEGENPFIITDDSSYIIAQSTDESPMWIFINTKEKEKMHEIARVIQERLVKNKKLCIISNEEYIKEILEIVSLKSNIKYEINMKMIAYACTKVNECISKGKIVHPSKNYRDILAKLIMQMEKDAEKKDVTEKDAYGYADDNVDSKKLYLWNDDGNITAMAKVGHRTNKYARINTVVTERSSRNKGYAKMLVGGISKMLLNENIIPMLYADASNQVSNDVYRKIGFEKQGEVTKYNFI